MANQNLPQQGPRAPQRPVMRPISQPRNVQNPRNYLRPDMRRAKVFDLNKMMQSWGAGQARYKEGDTFISKKILQNLDKVENLAGILSQKKFKENLKIVDDIKAEGKGKITYKFKDSDSYLAEETIDQNYIHNYNDLVWRYYQEKNKKVGKENNK